MDTRAAVVAKLKKLLSDSGKSLKQVSVDAGVPLSTIKSILNGQSRNPGVVTIKKICAALGISLAEFFQKL